MTFASLRHRMSLASPKYRNMGSLISAGFPVSLSFAIRGKQLLESLPFKLAEGKNRKGRD